MSDIVGTTIVISGSPYRCRDLFYVINSNADFRVQYSQLLQRNARGFHSQAIMVPTGLLIQRTLHERSRHVTRHGPDRDSRHSFLRLRLVLARDRDDLSRGST